MQEQMELMKQVNEFLERRGIKAAFMAEQCGIDKPHFYSAKTGYRQLTGRQMKKLRDFMTFYDERLGAGFEQSGTY